MNNFQVKAILLDLDNTLVDTKGADTKAYSKVENYICTNYQHFNSKEAILAFQKLLKEKEIDPDGIKTPDEWRTGLWQTALGSDVSLALASEVYQLWKDTRIEGIFFTKEIKSFLRALRLKYKLLLLTNGDSVIQRSKIKQCNARDYFDGMVISGDEPHAKPHISIFEKSFKMLSVTSTECIMVGDSLATDIEGGINSDCLATVWINPGGHPPASSAPKPHYTISSILELTNVLDKIANKS
ncbi:N-acylneuraminate-9-phosphatase-like [Antedon mediterranea]|uniref:N-acylneuraminate-9-phosphatase-like n=1 Tax=Antedon mediterranea TaxID=105859 RepID=UPI003AF4FEEF